MRKINFITNEDLNTTSGGWSGINWNIHRQLSNYFKIKYVGPIKPPMNIPEKFYSKILRSLGMKGNFTFFSDKRLNSIKDQVLKELTTQADYNFFFGQTPWLNCNFDIPYGVYLDADFQTYLEIFSSPKSFLESDIERIAKKEEQWLQGARDIFVGSQWAWEQMLKYYTLQEEQKVVVHTGGNIAIPKRDQYQGDLNLVFISLNFEKKGGFICVEAFSDLKRKYPHITLSIIGEKPPNHILEMEGVIYEGFLRKNNEEELKKFNAILEKAFLLIHPTKMDTMGAVLIEAGYFGCPSIAPDSFGIPELVLHDKTGFIVQHPFNYTNFVEKIELLINDKKRYLSMRKNAWTYTRTKLTWDHIGVLINNTLSYSK